jgi:hypothetical protein
MIHRIPNELAHINLHEKFSLLRYDADWYLGANISHEVAAITFTAIKLIRDYSENEGSKYRSKRLHP